VIASTDKDHMYKDESKELYFTEAEPLKVFDSHPRYVPHLKSNVISFSTVLLSKSEMEPIGIIVNNILWDDAKQYHATDYNYTLLIAANKIRIMDFSSDGFIKICTEEIAWRKDRIHYYVNRLNTHLIKNKMPLDHDIIELFITDLGGTVVSSTDNRYMKTRIFSTCIYILYVSIITLLCA